tara:strand:- start:74 stop:457 length:384 start_codon:yes stop_codon:yes gene_type:complete
MNAAIAIEVTLLGILMLFRLVQPENAVNPIEITLSGIVTLVRPVQLENAAIPMYFTGKPSKLLGMIREPLADSSQSDKVYALPLWVKVRSLCEAARKDVTNNSDMSMYLNFISVTKKACAILSTGKL